MCNNPNLDFVNINAFKIIAENLSICSQDIERKRNYDGRTFLHLDSWWVLTVSEKAANKSQVIFTE